MKWTRDQLLRMGGNVQFDVDLEIDDAVFAEFSRIIAVEDLHVDGRGWLEDSSDRFYADLHVSGVMICPDAITNEEIEVPFDTDSQEIYVFGEAEEEEERSVDDDVIDLLPAVIADILLEVPLQVTELADDEYPEGDGWKVYSEADYQKMQEEKIDPRLAVLKDFKEEE